MPNNTPFPKSSIRNTALRIATLAALCWAVYGQSIGFEFLPFDDYEIYTNPFIVNGLSVKGIVHFFTHYVGPNWFPLNWISHMTVYELFGPEPWSEHLANIVLHTCNTLLLFLFLHRATGRPWRSWLAAGLFAAHPLHAESVAWISERKDVLSAFFFMLTLLAYERYARRKGLLRYLLVFFLLLLGLMAKSMLVTLPCVFLLLDFWPLGRLKTPKDCARLFIEKIPFFVLSVLFCLVAFYGAKHVGTVGETSDQQFLSNLTNALVSYCVYLKRLFVPFRLAFFYPHPGDALPLWKGGLALAGIGCLSLLFFLQRRKRPYVLSGWLWFLGVLVPVIGIVQPGLQGMADRYAYLPFIGLYVALVWFAADLKMARDTTRQWKIAAACLLLVLLGTRAWHQAGTWRNSETLATNAIAQTQNNYVAHMMLMGAYAKQGRNDKAEEQYELARTISPYYVSLFHEKHALNNMRKGDYDKALVHYRRALAVRPTAIAAYNLGLALEKTGQREDARRLMRKALELDPTMAQAQTALQRLQHPASPEKEALFQYPVRFPKAATIKACQRASSEAPAETAVTGPGLKDISLEALFRIFETNAIPSRMENTGNHYFLTFSGPRNEQITWNFLLQHNAFEYQSGSRDNKKLSSNELGALYGMLLQLGSEAAPSAESSAASPPTPQ